MAIVTATQTPRERELSRLIVPVIPIGRSRALSAAEIITAIKAGGQSLNKDDESFVETELRRLAAQNAKGGLRSTGGRYYRP